MVTRRKFGEPTSNLFRDPVWQRHLARENGRQSDVLETEYYTCESIQEDWKKAAANNMLDSMTIPQLKEYCDAHNLKKGGKKGDLVDRVYEHIKQ